MDDATTDNYLAIHRGRLEEALSIAMTAAVQARPENITSFVAEHLLTSSSAATPSIEVTKEVQRMNASMSALSSHVIHAQTEKDRLLSEAEKNARRLQSAEAGKKEATAKATALEGLLGQRDVELRELRAELAVERAATAKFKTALEAKTLEAAGLKKQLPAALAAAPTGSGGPAGAKVASEAAIAAVSAALAAAGSATADAEGEGTPNQPDWSVNVWLGGLPAVLEVLGAALLAPLTKQSGTKGGAPSAPSTQQKLAFLGALAHSADGLSALLSGAADEGGAGLLPQLAAALSVECAQLDTDGAKHEASTRLHSPTTPPSQAAAGGGGGGLPTHEQIYGEYDKFSSEGGAAFDLAFGTIDVFFKGLTTLLGPADVNLRHRMEIEHVQSRIDSERPFVTGNYGISTTSKTEWNFVVHPASDLSANSMTIDSSRWPHEMKGIDEKKMRKPVVLLDPSADSADSASSFADPLSQKLSDAWRERNAELVAIDTPELLIDEVIGGRLYSGPLFMKYNAVLRGGDQNGVRASASAKFQADLIELCGDGTKPTDGTPPRVNLYTTTIHVISSAIVKLGKLTKPTMVYRGLSGVGIPESIKKGSVDGVRGGVEYGFLSTTMDPAVAKHYGASRGFGVVFEVQMGMIDRGADISWLSQYPHEKEILFPPLTGLEFRSERIEHKLLLVEMRLSVNLTALTIEQVVSRRRMVVVDMANNMRTELESELATMQRENPKVELIFTDKYADYAKQMLGDMLEPHETRHPNYYNDDGDLSNAIQASVDSKRIVSGAWSGLDDLRVRNDSLRDWYAKLNEAAAAKKPLPLPPEVLDLSNADGGPDGGYVGPQHAGALAMLLIAYPTLNVNWQLLGNYELGASAGAALRAAVHTRMKHAAEKGAVAAPVNFCGDDSLSALGGCTYLGEGDACLVAATIESMVQSNTTKDGEYHGIMNLTIDMGGSSQYTGDIKDAGIEALASAVASAPPGMIDRVKLGSTRLNCAALMAPSDSKEAAEGLKVDLSSSGLGDPGMLFLKALMRAGKIASLQALDLSWNKIGEKFAALAYVMAPEHSKGPPRGNPCDQLVELNLRNNLLDDGCLVALADSLDQGGLLKLRRLMMHKNRFSDAPLKELGTALTRHARLPLEHLGLGGNAHIKFEAKSSVDSWAALLQATTELYVSSCSIGDDGVATLAKALQRAEAETLVCAREVDISYNHIDAGGLQLLKRLSGKPLGSDATVKVEVHERLDESTMGVVAAKTLLDIHAEGNPGSTDRSVTSEHAAGPLIVVGSLNVDLCARSHDVAVWKGKESTPGANRDVLFGSDFELMMGGKGANQAYAAAQLTTKQSRAAPPIIIGMVGKDSNGEAACESLQKVGVDVTHVAVTPDRATGVALITSGDDKAGKDFEGEAAILIVKGANSLLRPSNVVGPINEMLGTFDKDEVHGGVLLTGPELQTDTVAEALQLGARRGLSTIFHCMFDDPNEVRAAQLSAMLLATSVLVLNSQSVAVLQNALATAAAAAAGGDKTRRAERVSGEASQVDVAASVALILSRMPATSESGGLPAVIVADKVGTKGCWLYTRGGADGPDAMHIDVPREFIQQRRALDAVGDIDAFNATIARMLSLGCPLPLAVQCGTHVAAVSVQRRGCQSAFPSADELATAALPFTYRRPAGAAASPARTIALSRHGSTSSKEGNVGSPPHMRARQASVGRSLGASTPG